MKTYTCKCCGMTIEAGDLTDLQLAAVGALEAALVTVKAAGETRLKAVVTPALDATRFSIAVVSKLIDRATTEQGATMTSYLDHARTKLAPAPVAS